MTIFDVHDIFFLQDGKTVFAGSYSSGSKTVGAYRISVDGRDIGVINISEEMTFPSKNRTDIALYTFDPIRRDQIDSNRKIALILSE